MTTSPVAASPRVRSAFLWMGSAVTVVALTSMLFNLLNAVAWNTYVVEHFVAEAELDGIETIEVRNSAGGIEVIGVGAGGAKLTSEVTDGVFSADHGYRLDAERLVVTGDCRFAFATNCRVDHHLEAPSSLALVLRSNHGDLSVTDTSGPIRADARFGEVTIGRVSGPLEVDNRFGSIRLRDLRSQLVRVEQTFGELQASFIEAPAEVSVVSRFGAVVIEVPDDGGTYAVTGSSSFGERRIEVRTDPDSARRIHVDHDFGDLTIRYPR
jgi:hypothetical protein